MQKLRAISFVFLSSLLLFSCSSNKQITETGADFNENNSSTKLLETINKISPSILKLDVLVFYKSWYFEEETLMQLDAIDFNNIDDECDFSEITSESVSGTAIVLMSNAYLCGIITCAHVVDYPDTIYTYHDVNNTIIRSVSIKQEQNIYESGRSLENKIEIIAMDSKSDLALLKKSIAANEVIPPVFSLKTGRAEALNWGSKIYVLGYPRGKLMITDGIVSVDKSIKKRFISDALFNKGISGSPVFGLQEGSSDYVWLGMASSAASQNINFLEPIESSKNFNNLQVKVNEGAIINNIQLINYGLTYSISMEEIITFVDLHRQEISSAGFDADLIISK